jgi:drug/metabolite transporter (DMT)-like permease
VLGWLLTGGNFLVTRAGLWPFLGGFCFWLTIKSFYSSIRYIGPNLATLITNAHPAITPFVGVLILNEPYNVIKGAGSAVLLLSIYKISKRPVILN